MSEQYGRRLKLQVADAEGTGIDLSNLRVRFATRQADLSTPGTLYARIYNIQKSTAQLIGLGTFEQVQLRFITLQVGYGDGDLGTIFYGQIKQTRYGRESPTDTFLDILAADGDEGYNWGVVNATLAAGADAAACLAVAQRALGEYGVGAGYQSVPVGQQLPRGRVLYGMAWDNLREICETNGLSPSVVEGKLQLLPLNGYLPPPPVKLTDETGMIGLPEQTQDGIHIRALMNPELRIGRRVEIANASIQRAALTPAYDWTSFAFMPKIKDNDGVYKIFVAEHTGDTRGTEWYTDLTCIGIGTDVPIALVGRLVTVPGP